jgi:hypothetical protein
MTWKNEHGGQRTERRPGGNLGKRHMNEERSGNVSREGRCPGLSLTSFDASWPVGRRVRMLNRSDTCCYGMRVKHGEEQKTECLYTYSINRVRTHSKQYYNKHIDYTLAINRSNDTKYLEHIDLSY